MTCACDGSNKSCEAPTLAIDYRGLNEENEVLGSFIVYSITITLI